MLLWQLLLWRTILYITMWNMITHTISNFQEKKFNTHTLKNWGKQVILILSVSFIIMYGTKWSFKFSEFKTKQKNIFICDYIMLCYRAYDKLPSEGLLINCLGLVLVALAFCVFYVVTRPEYKRQAAPDEEHIQLTAN